MYLPVTVGNIVAMIFVSLSGFTTLLELNDACGQYLSVFQPYYECKILQYAPEPIPPEERLVMAVWAAPLFAITFFWFGYSLMPVHPPPKLTIYQMDVIP